MKKEDRDYIMDDYRSEVLESIDTYNDLMAQFMVVRNTLKPKTIYALENDMVDAERDGNDVLASEILRFIEYSKHIKSIIEKIEDTSFDFECKDLIERLKQ